MGLLGRSFGAVSNEELERWATDTGVSFPVVDDTAGTYGQYDRVGASAPFPLDVIVDQRGVVRYQSVGYEPDAMAKTIDELLAR